jgi:hypothetical protein
MAAPALMAVWRLSSLAETHTIIASSEEDGRSVNIGRRDEKAIYRQFGGGKCPVDYRRYCLGVFEDVWKRWRRRAYKEAQSE